MPLSPHVQRNAFGTIDFDHYRRIAAQVRTETIRCTVHRTVGVLGEGVAFIIARLRRSPSLPIARPTATSR